MSTSITYEHTTVLHTHKTHIHDVHKILVPYNYACPNRGLIHRDRESFVIRPLPYLQATTAGQENIEYSCDKAVFWESFRKGKYVKKLFHRKICHNPAGIFRFFICFRFIACFDIALRPYLGLVL